MCVIPHRDNVPEFIAGFTGDDRYIVDYLVEDVLQRLQRIGALVELA